MSLAGLALARSIEARALELGFAQAACGPLRPVAHADAFARWLDDGCAGGMAYLAETRELRLDPERLLPGARSVVAVALAYASDAPEGEWAGVARYARGPDYHDVILPRLRDLRRHLTEATGGRERCRLAVDTSAVLERELARQAGLGWVGRNTMLLSPELGSYFLLGIMLTTAELPGGAEVADGCGSCRACLVACPTGAFTAPYRLDARRCVSYLTIEHRGDIAPELRGAVGHWIFGCDVCQEVCPWNRPEAREAAGLRAGYRARGAAPSVGALGELLALDPGAFRQRFRKTALWRARRTGLLRNAAVALGNLGGAGARTALMGALGDPEPEVREAARWGLEQGVAPVRVS